MMPSPFFIDWFDCPHPASTSPGVGPLVSVRLAYANAAPLQGLVSELGLDAAVTVANGDAELTITFDSRRGVVGYTGRTPAGFTLRD